MKKIAYFINKNYVLLTTPILLLVVVLMEHFMLGKTDINIIVISSVIPILLYFMLNTNFSIFSQKSVEVKETDTTQKIIKSQPIRINVKMITMLLAIVTLPTLANSFSNGMELSFIFNMFIYAFFIALMFSIFYIIQTKLLTPYLQKQK